MGAFEHFPYTNFHDLNLDWIIDKIKEWEKSVTDFETKFADIESDWAEIERAWKKIESDWTKLSNEVEVAIAQIDAKIEQGIGDYRDDASQSIAAINDLVNSGDVAETTAALEAKSLGNAGIGISGGVFSSAASSISYYAVKAGNSYKISGANYTNPYTTTGVSAAFSTVTPTIGAAPRDIILYGKTTKEDVDIYYTPTMDGYVWLCDSNIGGGKLEASTSRFTLSPRFKLVKNSTEPSTNSIDMFRNIEITEEAYILISNTASLSYDCDIYTESGNMPYTFSFPARTTRGMIHLLRYTDTDQWLMEIDVKATDTSATFRSGTVLFTSDHLTNLKIATNLDDNPLIPAGTRIVTIGR